MAASRHYRIQALDDAAATHELGTLLILNFSGLELAGTFNGRQMTVSQGINRPIRTEGAAAIVLHTPFRGRSYQAYAESIAARSPPGPEFCFSCTALPTRLPGGPVACLARRSSAAQRSL